MEILDVVDEQGNPTGKTVTRENAHESGILHRTAHVWIFRERQGVIQVLLQKRSANKDSYPGCYDISSAGHIPAGVDYIPSALRELKEELGLNVRAAELEFCGKRRIQYEETFHHKKFIDNQVSAIFALWRDVETWNIVCQESEVEEVIWMDFKKCIRKVENHEIPNCIMMEELNLLRTYLRNRENA